MILSFLLQSVLWFLSAPQAERMLGQQAVRRAAHRLDAGGLRGRAALGQAAYGLFGPLFGVFAAVLVLVWPEAQVRNRFLVMIGVNLLLILVISRRQGLPEVIGAMLAGAGLTRAAQRAADRPLPGPWTPQLIVGGAPPCSCCSRRSPPPERARPSGRAGAAARGSGARAPRRARARCRGSRTTGRR